MLLYSKTIGLIPMLSCQQTLTEQENIQARSQRGNNVAVSYKLAQGCTLGPNEQKNMIMAGINVETKAPPVAEIF